jgi:hypothetical protein
MFLTRILTALRHACSARRDSKPALPVSRPNLEQLEDRVTPSTLNISISINPNFFLMNLQETVNATLTPTGTETGTPTGSINFNVNNQVKTINLSGNQAAATFTVPFIPALGGQSMSIIYNPDTTSTFSSSTFLSPVFLNLDNFVLPSTVTFGTPTATFTNFTTMMGATSTAFNSQFGETNVVQFGFIPVTFNYAQDGTISTVQFLGITFPGFTAAGLINPVAPFVFPTSASSH